MVVRLTETAATLPSDFFISAFPRLATAWQAWANLVFLFLDPRGRPGLRRGEVLCDLRPVCFRLVDLRLGIVLFE